MKYFLSLFVVSFFISCINPQDVPSISTRTLKELLVKVDTIQIVDVRTPEEIKNGAIKTAIFANFFNPNFTTEITKQLTKNKAVYLYCQSGYRSGKAAKILQEKGYVVYNVIGGYNKWYKENKYKE